MYKRMSSSSTVYEDLAGNVSVQVFIWNTSSSFWRLTSKYIFAQALPIQIVVVYLSVKSLSMRHMACLSTVLCHFRKLSPSLNKQYMISNEPTMQYRSKKNLFLSSVPFNLGLKKHSWNFLEAEHGQGAADGVCATLNRRADGLVAKGTDIRMDVCSMTSLRKRSLPGSSLLL